MILNCELDINTGEVIYETTDLDLPTVLPCELTRRYISSQMVNGILGWGWECNFSREVSLNEERLVKHDPIDGDTVHLLTDCDGIKGPQLTVSGFVGNQLALKYPDRVVERYVRHPDVDSLCARACHSWPKKQIAQ